jgi:archaellin
VPDSEPVVQYSLKEILDRLESKLDNVVNTTLKDVTNRLSLVEQEIAARKHTSASWITVLSVIAALTAAGAAILVAFHGG